MIGLLYVIGILLEKNKFLFLPVDSLLNLNPYEFNMLLFFELLVRHLLYTLQVSTHLSSTITTACILFKLFTFFSLYLPQLTHF